MELLPLHLDIIIISLSLIMAILGAYNGFLKEFTKIISWIIAGLITYLLWPYAEGRFDKHFDSALIADTVVITIIFSAIVLIIGFITKPMITAAKESGHTGIGRVFGFGLGAIEAFFLLSLTYVMMAWIYPPEDRPDWIIEAKTRPVIERTAKICAGFMPGMDNIKIETPENRSDNKNDQTSSEELSESEEEDKFIEAINIIIE